MFFDLVAVLEEAGFGAAALFDLHPGQLLAFAEAGFEREHQRSGSAWPGRGLNPGDLASYGTCPSPSGKVLDAETFLQLASAAIARPARAPQPAWAWLVEGAGVVTALSALVATELGGRARRLNSPRSRRWLRTTEDLFGGQNLLTLRSVLRPTPAETRAFLYSSCFGAPIGERGIVPDGFEDSFTTHLAAWLAGEAGAAEALKAAAEVPPEFARESFAAVGLVSWFYLSLSLPDSPLAADLGVVGEDLTGRLAAVRRAVQREENPKAAGLLEAAIRLDRALGNGLVGAEEDRAALAALWPSLEGEPDEAGAEAGGGDVGLAFGGAVRFAAAMGAFSFGDTLQATPLTVIDPDARIRTGPPSYGVTNERLPKGAEVVVVELSSSAGTYYVRVTTTDGGAPCWTKLSNLGVPANALVGQINPYDRSEKGPFAMWEKGVFTKITPLWLVGGNGKMVLVAEETLMAWVTMCAAAARDEIDLTINSAFRSYPEQQACYDTYKANGSPVAAKPGGSAHQSGVALDISMGMGTGSLTTDVSKWTAPFRWMIRNGWRHGFVRTVKSECWHWEYRPERAVEDDVNGDLKALVAAGG